MTTPQLTTNRVTLREPRRSDWEDIHDYMQHGTIQAYMPNEPEDYTEDDAKNKVTSLKSLTEQDNANAWVIQHNNDNKVIGIIDEEHIQTHRKARLGYHISPDYQRKGLMTEALTQVIRHGFNEQTIHKFTAEIAAANKASQSFIESIGFKEEGTLRAELFIKGSFHDIKHYGLLKQEFQR